MTTKQWLGRATGLNTLLFAIEKSKLAEWEKITKVTAPSDGDVVNSTPDPHKFDRYIELVNQYNTLWDRQIAIKTEIMAAISKLDKPLYITILMNRYVDGMTFPAIAEEVHLSQRHVERLHGRALLEMGGIIFGDRR